MSRFDERVKELGLSVAEEPGEAPVRSRFTERVAELGLPSTPRGPDDMETLMSVTPEREPQKQRDPWEPLPGATKQDIERDRKTWGYLDRVYTSPEQYMSTPDHPAPILMDRYFGSLPIAVQRQYVANRVKGFGELPRIEQMAFLNSVNQFRQYRDVAVQSAMAPGGQGVIGNVQPPPEFEKGRGAVGEFHAGVKRGWAGVVGNFMAFNRGVSNLIPTPLGPYEGPVPGGAGPTWTDPEYWKRKAETQPGMRPEGKLRMALTPGERRRMLSWWTGQAGQMAPQMATAALAAYAGGPLAALGVTGISEGGEQYQTAKARGVAENRALGQMFAVGIVNGILEMAPLDRVVQRLGKKAAQDVTQRLVDRIAAWVLETGKQTAFEGGTEGLQQIVSQEFARLHGYEAPKGERLDEIIDSVLLGAVMGGVMGGGEAAITDMRQGADRQLLHQIEGEGDLRGGFADIAPWRKGETVRDKRTGISYTVNSVVRPRGGNIAWAELRDRRGNIVKANAEDLDTRYVLKGPEEVEVGQAAPGEWVAEAQLPATIPGRPAEPGVPIPPQQTTAQQPPVQPPTQRRPLPANDEEVFAANTKAYADEMEQEYHLDPRRRRPSLPNQEAANQAHAIMEQDSTAPDRLYAELKERPRATTPVETVLMDQVVGRARQFANTAMLDQIAADESDDPIRKSVANGNAAAALEDFAVKMEVGTLAGSEAGAALQSLKMGLQEDLKSLADATLRARSAKGGAPLTAAETAQVAGLVKRFADAEQQLADQPVVVSEKAHAATVQEAKADKRSGKKPITPADVLEGLRSGKRTDLSNAAHLLAMWYVQHGITERDAVIDHVHADLQQIVPTLTRRQAMDALSRYGQYKELDMDAAKVIVRDIKGQARELAKLEDIASKTMPLKTGLEYPEPTDAHRALIAEVHEALKQSGLVVTDIRRQIATVDRTIQTRLKNQIRDLGKAIQDNQRLVKRGAPQVYSDKAKALLAERNELLGIYRQMFPPEPMSLEAKIAQTDKALRRRLTYWQKRVEAIELHPPKNTPAELHTAELDHLRAQIDDAKADLDWLKSIFEPGLTPDQKALKARKAALTRSIASWQARITNGEFDRVARPEPKVDPEVIKLLAEKERVVTEFNNRKAKWLWKRKSLAAKGIGAVAAYWDLVRSIMTSMDVSGIGRQGLFMLAAHPVRTVGTIVRSGPAIWSTKQAERVAAQRHANPNYTRYRDVFKLAETTTHGGLTQQEELFMSTLAGGIPIVSNTQAFYVEYLDNLRLDAMLAAERTMTADGTFSVEQGREVANFINNATGRGSLGGLERSAVTLNRLFFAPRLLSARLHMLSGSSFVFAKTPGMRLYVAKEYARFFAGMASMYGLALLAGASVERDPRSADFMKWKWNNTRRDPLAGVPALVVLGARLKTGEYKTGGGEIKAISGEETPFGGLTANEVLWNAVRSKFSPALGFATDIATRKNVVGQPVTAKTVAKTLTGMPLTAEEIYAASKDLDIPHAILASILSEMGFSGQTYEKKTGSRRGRADRGR